MWRMQPAQDQPLALTTVRPLCPTNGKEEEVNAGEEAELARCCQAEHVEAEEIRRPEVKGRLDDMVITGAPLSFNLRNCSR